MVCRHSCLQRASPQTWAAEIWSDREMFAWWYHSVITSFARREEEGVQRTATQSNLYTLHISCILPEKAISHFKTSSIKHLSSGVCAWHKAVIMSLLGLKFFHKEIRGYFILLQSAGVMLAGLSQMWMDVLINIYRNAVDAKLQKWVTYSGKPQNWYGPCIPISSVRGKKQSFITQFLSTLKSFMTSECLLFDFLSVSFQFIRVSLLMLLQMNATCHSVLHPCYRAKDNRLEFG